MANGLDSGTSFSGAGEITLLLRAWRKGDDGALDTVMELVMDTLRNMAQRSFLREAARHTLQPTALVNELYLKLLREKRVEVCDRVHFLGLVGRKMRQILVDYARKRKRRSPMGDPSLTVSLESVGEPSGPKETSFDMIALHEALNRLSRKAPRMGHIVEMRYFAGLTIAETSLALGLSERTVHRDWLVAKARLFQDLGLGRA